MSIVEQIPHLEKLLAIDLETLALNEKIEKEQGEIGGARAELEELDARLAQDGAAVAEMDRTRHDLGGELRNMDKQIERSRERLQRARNEREANAAERELDELRKLQRDRNEDIRKVEELVAQARNSIEQADARKAELSAQLEGSLEGSTRTVSELQARLAELKAERSTLIPLLPKMLVRRYESLLTRRSNPAAAVEGGVCQGCHIEIPPMLAHEMLAQQRFEECPFCHRIIYYSPPQPPAEAEAEAGTSA